MEQLFRQTELEIRLSLNLNVLDAQGVPRVMSLVQVLQAFLEHRMDVLIRRSAPPAGRDRGPARGPRRPIRIAYLNLDEVIRIIREEDEPKAVLMRAFELSERQAEAILNMRLRNLRRLEEQALVKEERALRAEGRRSEGPARATRPRRRATLKEEIAATGARFGDGPLGARRTTLGVAPVVDAEALEMPARAAAGHRGLLAPGLDPRAARPSRGRCRAQVQGGRRARASCCRRETTDKLAADQQRRPRLSAAGRAAAGRPRPGRAAAAADRSRPRRRAGDARGASPATAACCSPRARRAASSPRRRRSPRRPGPASRCSISTRASGWWSPARPRATTSRPSAATASC